MPRSYQAYPQNAVVTHSPQTVGSGDPSQAINNATQTFAPPSLLDICSGVTSGTSNPFMAGLNTLGTGSNTSGVGGQTGNMLSGLQVFADSLCGFALGGTSMGEVLEAARQLRASGGNLKETIAAARRLRDTVGLGTTPQSVLAGVEAVTTLVNGNPLAQSAISTGQTTVGISGSQVVDAINGSQTMADQSNQMLTGQTGSGASGTDLLNSAGTALNQNTANHVGNTSLTAAQSVSLKQQNLLVSQDFSSSTTVASEAHWSWDGTDGAPSTGTMGCAKVVCNGSQDPLVSSEIPVVVDETIEVSCQVKWSSLTYTGSNPIILAVEKYRQGKASNGSITYLDIGWYNVTTIVSPGASGDWTGISGTYVVEPGVDQLRFRLEAAKTVTVGTVKWDDAEFLKTDLIADDCVPGVGTTVDNIVTQLYGTAGAGFTHNDSAVALGNTASALTSVSAQLAALQAEGHVGSIAGDDFNWIGNILGGVGSHWGGHYDTFNLFGSPVAYYSANGVDAVWAVNNGGQTIQAWFDWEGSDPTSTTDYQLIQLVLDSAPTADVDLGGTRYPAHIRVFGRIAADWSTYISASLSSEGTYTVGYQSGGTFHIMNSGTYTVPGLSSVISLYCGDKPTTRPRHYRLEVGSVVISEFDEVGTSSTLGSSNRKYGWGAKAEGGSFANLGTPPKVNQWLGMDQ